MKTVPSPFYSRGTKCDGRLYLPDSEAPPVVIMAPGFGAEKEFRLPDYAEHFARKGLAVFLFDYRNFGESEGKPRNLVSPPRHLQDWQAALSHVQGLREVDGRRPGLWGTSFSGGHVLVTAAQNPFVSAVVAQVPFVDGLATMELFTLSFSVKGIVFGLLDLLGSAVLRRPFYVPIVGKPHTFAMLNTPESYEGYMSTVPEGAHWRNECPARISLGIPFYRPISKAEQVGCPVLVVRAEHDSLIPSDTVEKAAQRIKHARLDSYPVGHFDFYSDPLFEQVAERQAEFFLQHLGKE